MALPQREGRPALDISPDATPDSAAWAESYNTPANELNKPVPVRQGGPEANGWTKDTWTAVMTVPAPAKLPDNKG
jgi:hypothetical protein